MQQSSRLPASRWRSRPDARGCALRVPLPRANPSRGTTLARRTLPANVTGQFIRYDAAGTLALALTLSPDTRRVLVVGGVTDADQARVRSALDAATQLAPGRDIDRLDHLAFPEILQKVSTQPQGSIVLYMGFYRDARGDTYLPQ